MNQMHTRRRERSEARLSPAAPDRRAAHGRIRERIACGCALAVMMIAQVSTAAPVTYFGIDDSNVDLTNSNLVRGNFLATLSSYAEETMESIAGEADPTVFAGTEVQAATDFDQVFPFPPVAVSPINALLDQGPSTADGSAHDDWIQFAQPITAFGSYFAQGGDGPANTLTLRLENSARGTAKDVLVGTLGPSAPFFNIFFFGVTDPDGFDRVVMVETHDHDGILLDDMIAGHVVPEPDQRAILLTMFACLAASSAWRFRATIARYRFSGRA